jgi:hypothetical protein
VWVRGLRGRGEGRYSWSNRGKCVATTRRQSLSCRENRGFRAPQKWLNRFKQ